MYFILIFFYSFVLSVKCFINLSEYSNLSLLLECIPLLTVGFLSVRAAGVLAFISAYTG
jgi:hypothetical protein